MKIAVIGGRGPICAALFAAVCIGATPDRGAADGTSKVPLVYQAPARAIACDPEALAPMLIKRPAAVQARSTPSPRPDRSVRALLRAIQAIFHLARSSYLAMAARWSLSKRQWLRALAALGLGDRTGLTVSANGSDVSLTPWHAV